MRLEARSKTVLAITKSKAKMYEFGIPEADHIGLPHDPKNLLITTIGILGELAAQESRGEGQDGEDIQSLAFGAQRPIGLSCSCFAYIVSCRAKLSPKSSPCASCVTRVKAMLIQVSLFLFKE